MSHVAPNAVPSELRVASQMPEELEPCLQDLRLSKYARDVVRGIIWIGPGRRHAVRGCVSGAVLCFYGGRR